MKTVTVRHQEKFIPVSLPIVAAKSKNFTLVVQSIN